MRFAKLGKVRWTSHRDVARMWERALRRTHLPVAYTEGFTPRPKLSFGLALSTGHESVAEYLDVEIADDAVDVASLPARLSPALPDGIDVTAAAVIDARDDSLQEAVTSTGWELEAIGLPLEAVRERVARTLEAPSIVLSRQRKGAEVTEDVRPAIVALDVMGPPPCVGDGYAHHAVGALLACELGTRPRGLRPAELVAVLGPDLEEGHTRRIHQWIERDGARREPLPVGATDAPHASERVS